MGSLLGARLTKLEARAEAAGLTEEARKQLELSEALSHLCVEDLNALDEVLTAVFEREEVPGSLEEPHAVTDEHHRRALSAFSAALELVCRSGTLPPVSPEGKTLWS
jgi:hypothetical protein